MKPLRQPRRPSRRPERTEVRRLPDRREVWVRPVHPADAGPIAGGFALLNEEEVRRRYLHPVKSLDPAYLRRLVNPEPGRSFAVVAAEPLPPGQALVGALARLSRDPDGDGAEFAILVSHFLAGQGLGRLLMDRLVEWARANGIRSIRGDVLEDNVPMLALCRLMGFRTERKTAPGGGLVRVVLDLDAPRKRRMPRR
ncbi:GNAT family N-acetyltransferase [Arenimonas fontis]|uniref:GNAT family N-acetyltransferase n=1 Tax=Arenimonas fontis TaxID=2608255 RepID=A0A5B2ZEH6_9GAMM|nr:GNAT family N-acetyltransferase [Arenimonas fontis]KAA2285600.1 GNAT family N-acetyltransferase [Arenimonas fontis]